MGGKGAGIIFAEERAEPEMTTTCQFLNGSSVWAVSHNAGYLMARRKKANPLGDLFSVATMLPWWISLILAIVAYFVLHAFATADVAVAKNINEVGNSIVQSMLKGFAYFGQFVLPIIFLAGAAASAFAQAKRRRAAPGKEEPIEHTYQGENVPSIWVNTSRWNAELLSSLEWKRFEMVCAGLFERLGFVTKTTIMGADGGVDIHLYRPPAEQPVAIVQCKAWTGNSKVGVRFIRELHGVMASMKVAEGIFATTTTFSEEAKNYAKANGIDLMDGAAVLASILTLTDEQQAGLLRLATAGDYTTPTCPSCAVKMTKREPKAGGKTFWGCVNFPRCRSIINMAKA